MAKTAEKVDIKIGVNDYVITIKNKEKDVYKELIDKVQINLLEASTFEESTKILKDNIELFLGEGTFDQVFNECGNSVLKTMNEMFLILETVGNKVYEGDKVDLPVEEVIEDTNLTE